MSFFRLLATLPLLFSFMLGGQVLSSPNAVGRVVGSDDDLVGLWKARRWFGPFARGTLIIQKTGANYTADMMGQTLVVRLENGELAFDLPNAQGSFRGKFEGRGEILGHWIPPGDHAQYVGGKFVSHVRMKADGANRWSGQIVPFEDDFTIYLLIQKRPDGTMGVFMHSPENGYGGLVDRLVREGKGVKLIAKSGERETDFASGSYDAENQVLSIVFERGGTYDFKRDDDQSDFYSRGKYPSRYVYRQPLARDDGWPTASLDEVNIDRPAMERFIQTLVDLPMDSIESPQIHGVLIARHGKLVLEEYFHGEHRDKMHETRSAAKSVTAVIAGAAMQAGLPLKLSSPVYEVMNGGTFPADADPKKRTMTLEHLLTMSSGHFCDDGNPNAPGNENGMLDQDPNAPNFEPDYYRYYMKVPLDRIPGEKAVYCSADPNLALGMVGRAAGENPMYVFDRLVGGPMKIFHYGWLQDPALNPYGGGSTKFLPRDFMKFGQLMLNGGMWEGHRILSRDFVAHASAPLFNLNNIQYGYLWWSINYPYKNRTVRAYFAGGAGSQAVMVVPDLDLVVAIFAGNYHGDSRTAGSTRNIKRGDVQQNLVPRFILPAVREVGDDKTAPVIEREFKSPYGRAPYGHRRSTMK